MVEMRQSTARQGHLLRAVPLPKRLLVRYLLAKDTYAGLNDGESAYRLLKRKPREICINGEPKLVQPSVLAMLKDYKPLQDEPRKDADGKVSLCFCPALFVDGKWYVLGKADPGEDVVHAELNIAMSHKMAIFSLPPQVMDFHLWAPIRAMELKSLKNVESVNYLLTFHTRVAAQMGKQECIFPDALVKRIFPKNPAQAGTEGYIFFATSELLNKPDTELWKCIH